MMTSPMNFKKKFSLSRSKSANQRNFTLIPKKKKKLTVLPLQKLFDKERNKFFSTLQVVKTRSKEPSKEKETSTTRNDSKRKNQNFTFDEKRSNDTSESQMKSSHTKTNTTSTANKNKNNLEVLHKLINESKEIQDKQSAILEKCGELTKRIKSSDLEVEGLYQKNETDDWSFFIERYSKHLKDMLNNIHSQWKGEGEEKEKEEHCFDGESKIKIMQKFLVNELNSVNELCNEIGIGYLFPHLNYQSFEEDSLKGVFQNIKKQFKCLTCKCKGLESEISRENKAYAEELKNFRMGEGTGNININKQGGGDVFGSFKNNNLNEELIFSQKLIQEYEIQIEELKKRNYFNTCKIAEMENIRKVPTVSYYGKSIDEGCMGNEMTIGYGIGSNKPSEISSSFFEGYRRNKDLRVPTQTNELKLEHRYSDSYFFKNESSQYDVMNTNNSPHDKKY